MTAKLFQHAQIIVGGKWTSLESGKGFFNRVTDTSVSWVVLTGGDLVGHNADSSEVGGIIEKARAEGIKAPYVKFISEDSEPIWMGVAMTTFSMSFSGNS